MGEYIGLRIRNHEYLFCKNSFGDLLTIFSKDDLKIEQAKYEDDEPYQRRYFTTTVLRARKCLDCLGYTISAAKRDFEKSKIEELEYLDCRVGSDEEYETEYNEIEKNLTFEEWENAVKRFALIIANDSYDSSINGYKDLEAERNKQLSVSEKIVIETLPSHSDKYYGLFGEKMCVWNVFRIILDAFDSEEIIELDYTYLYDGGWCNETPEEKDYEVPKTIILTEGKFDVEVLTESMNLLFPYMSKFYSFMNFSEYKVQGSTNFLTHYLRAFIASGIQNRVIAIYDNDSAGRAEMMGLSQITIPDNYRVISLPELELAHDYPTLGPNGKESMNINGKACSIELFLGQDVLMNDNELIPVHWKGYNEKTQTYQGEVMNKSLIQDRFRNKIKKASSDGIDAEYWKEMNLLLETIFSVFIDE